MRGGIVRSAGASYISSRTIKGTASYVHENPRSAGALIYAYAPALLLLLEVGPFVDGGSRHVM